MISKVFILLAVVATAVVAQNVVTTRPCTDGSPEPVSFTSNDCTAAGVCTLRRNEIFTGQATFDTLGLQITEAIVRIAASLAGIGFPMPIPEGYEKACDFLVGSSCPLAPGTRHVWGLQFPIQNFLPAASGVNIELRVVNQDGATIACAVVTGNIV